jgi:hypothetical protein
MLLNGGFRFTGIVLTVNIRFMEVCTRGIDPILLPITRLPWFAVTYS